MTQFIEIEVLPDKGATVINTDYIMAYKHAVANPKIPLEAKSLILMQGGIPLYNTKTVKELDLLIGRTKGAPKEIV